MFYYLCEDFLLTIIIVILANKPNPNLNLRKQERSDTLLYYVTQLTIENEYFTKASTILLTKPLNCFLFAAFFWLSVFHVDVVKNVLLTVHQ